MAHRVAVYMLFIYFLNSEFSQSHDCCNDQMIDSEARDKDMSFLSILRTKNILK